MTTFGPSGGRGAGRPGGRDEDNHEGRISFKDNRRIDPKTGAVRQPGAGLPDPGSAAAEPGNPDNATQPITAAVSADSDDLAAARAEVSERTADLKRITAEYANYRKRVERDRLAAAAAGRAAVVTELLHVCDDIDRAGEHGDLTGGFKNVADKLTGILERLGLSHFGAEGDEFDPVIHEAVQFATSADVDHPTVTTVLRLGYQLEDKVLRPAVVVVTGPEHEAGVPDVDAAAGAAGDAGRFGSPEDPVVIDRPADVADGGATTAQ